MANIRARNNKLLFDFMYRGIRCREQTALLDNPLNRSRLTGMLHKIETDIRLNQFVFKEYFPSSTRCAVFAECDQQIAQKKREQEKYLAQGAMKENVLNNIPTFLMFAAEWLAENRIQWKLSHSKNIEMIFERYLIPAFGAFRLNDINRTHIIKFRAKIAVPKRASQKEKLSNDWINHIMTPLRGILNEAASRYGFSSPFVNIKPLRVERPHLDPFSLSEVKLFLMHVRHDFINYYTVRFFTAMRTAEIDGLQWKYVNFNRHEIIIQETLVNGHVETPKTLASYRAIQASKTVMTALKKQRLMTGQQKYVFCNAQGNPLDHRNVTKRIWYPTLDALNIKRRRPYQTRHTCATLWLAAGENPEWIAKQMGHSTTKMLFEVYSRYVPNITRQDGSAFERLIQVVSDSIREARD